MRTRAVSQHRAVLSFGRGYHIDFMLFTRLLRAVQEGLSRSCLAGQLGISKSRLTACIALARGFDLLTRNRSLRLTPLGNVILGYDAFFQDPGTLWFLHYVVASEERQLVWNHFATTFLPGRQRFTLKDFRAWLMSLQKSNSKAAKRSLYQETYLVLDTYVKRSFVQLEYLSHEKRKPYQRGNSHSLPPLVLGACLARYRDRHQSDATALLVADVLTAPNSPGVILHLHEDDLRTLLEQIKTVQGIELESRADLDQVRLNETMTDVKWMELYYDCR
ncbi:hypothetical protein KSF_108480 [Reticulibacter mediterranei]|uniref:DUF4007 domain-containing protein n=1 Tax=Reticulibacter mediterranei TaxID=2778369 RepID=A0A8J3J1X2_9CHLR|nr:DUF4007 family protein [Reticulibacter mediterranei]GHP00801.1 hypothetical protein KSF_108480 [Reticulibacter mediterranei]